MLDRDDDTKRRLAEATLLTLVVVSLVTLNVVSVVQRDLLDSEQTTSSFEDTDFYERLSVGLQQELARNISKATTAEMNATQLAESAVTEAYTRGVVNANIDEVYAFLDGERATADIRWNLTGAEQRLARQIDDPEVRRDVNATVPDAVLVQEDIASGPLGTAQMLTGLFPFIVGVSATSILLGLGIEGYRKRSSRHVSCRMGKALSLGGVVSVTLGVLVLAALQLVALSFEGDVAIDPAIISDGLSRVVANATVTLVQQSVLLLLLGLSLVFLGRTDTHRPAFGVSSPASADAETDQPGAGTDEP